MKWRKSSYSNGEASTCVELAQLPEAVGIRDSKNPTGGHLTVSARTLGRLVSEIKSGRHSL